ncbi:MAG: glycosyltransferase [Vicinamibacterales bacterium]|jgi:glycosyltransferase involved in cell wall biosynthesis
MKRVLLVQPSLQPPGGSSGVASWVLQALVPEHRVTVLSWQPVDVGPINRFYDTRLQRSDFDTIVVPRHWTVTPDLLPTPATLVKLALLMRYTRKVSAGFDVIFGVHNETDYGRRGIQYIHYPSYLRPRPQVDLRWYHQPRAALRAYYSLTDRIAGFSIDRLKANLTLVNSNWTGEHVRGFLGGDPRTLYPPVADPGAGLPWSERAPDFLAIGRISPEKDYERIMRILSRVRARVPDLRLTIVGTWDRHTARYARGLQALAESIGSWIQFRQNVSRDEIRGLMGSHRYGLHGMREEHFGMAPAELARAGVIVWVPKGGGQMEIVGNEPSLMYDSDDEAVAKITAVLADPAEQDRLRRLLAARAEMFSTDRFIREVRDIVDSFRE